MKVQKLSQEEIELQQAFIFMRPMAQLPKTKDEIDKHGKHHHVVLTGWKNQYSLKHDRYHKVLYSSHSSNQELYDFVKAVRPKQLIFNLLVNFKSEDTVGFLYQLVRLTEAGKASTSEKPVVANRKKQGKLAFTYAAKTDEQADKGSDRSRKSIQSGSKG